MFRGLITALLLVALSAVPYVGCAWASTPAEPVAAAHGCCGGTAPDKRHPAAPHEACCEKACCTILTVASAADLVLMPERAYDFVPVRLSTPESVSFRPPVPPPRFLNLA